MNFQQFEAIILRPVLADWEHCLHRSQAIELVGETIWHESDQLRALAQYPRDGVSLRRPFSAGLGPASMEKLTWNWLLQDYVKKDCELSLLFDRWCKTGVPAWEEFGWNLALNVLGCRLRYWASPKELPNFPLASKEAQIQARSHAWFTIYNGSGVEERRLKYIEDAKKIPWLEG